MRPFVRRLLPLILCLIVASCQHGVSPEYHDSENNDYGPVGDFHLIERSGRPVTQDDLRGKAWVASFVFTRCTGPCPQITGTMARLQNELAKEKDILLVTFTVDPEHDDPKELQRYAEHFGADEKRWLFLTGKEEEIYALLRNSFHVHADQNKGDDRKPGAEVMHDVHLIAVDKKGHIRGYCTGIRDQRDSEPEAQFETNLRRLRDKLVALAHEKP